MGNLGGPSLNRRIARTIAVVAAAASLPVIEAGAAHATYGAPRDGSIVFTSSYAVPCTTTPCRKSSASHPGGSPNLWIVDAAAVGGSASASTDTTNTRQLTDTTGNDAHASFSPDGQHVVFDRDTTNNPQIWVVAQDNAPAAEDSDPATPLGAHAADGAVRLTDDVSSDTNPSFAPDGVTIAFVQDDAHVVTLNTGVSGASPVDVVDDTIAENRPVFDPVDQSKLIYTSGSHHLMLVTGVGTAAQHTYDLSTASGLVAGKGADEWPDWAPDGSSVVFDSTRPLPGGTTTITQQLWTLTFSVSGSSATASASPVFQNGSGNPAVSGFKDIQPIWSPSGKQLAWTRTLGNSDVNSEMLPVSASRHLTTTATPMDLTLAGSNPTDSQPTWTRSLAAAPDPQTIQVTADPGALTISTPYTPSNPFLLGHAQLASNGTKLTATAPFGSSSNPSAGVTITDTRAGNQPWTASASASTFTDPASDSIDTTYLAFTGVTPVYVPGNAIQAPQVTTSDILAPPLGSPATAARPGLRGSPKSFASVAAGDGTVGVVGQLTLEMPTSIKAGTYTATITFTLA